MCRKILSAAAPASAAYRTIDCEIGRIENNNYSLETPIVSSSGRNGTKIGTMAAVRKATPSPCHELPLRNSSDNVERWPMASCTSVASTSTKPAVAAAGRSASVAESCCVEKVYDEEMEMHAGCVDWIREAIAAAATELRDATASRDAATALFPHGSRSMVVAYAAASGLLLRRKRSMLKHRAWVAVARDFRMRNRANVATRLYD